MAAYRLKSNPMIKYILFNIQPRIQQTIIIITMAAASLTRFIESILSFSQISFSHHLPQS